MANVESSSFMCERVIKITEVSLFSKLDRHRVSKSQGELLSDSSSAQGLKRKEAPS